MKDASAPASIPQFILTNTLEYRYESLFYYIYLLLGSQVVEPLGISPKYARNSLIPLNRC